MASVSLNPVIPQQGFGGEPTRPGKTTLASLDLDFLRSVTERRTKDGQPQKRRGPKPDSKPALTRRQELNRQAQRTHRERKELYIRALEDEVLRLKEVFSNVSQDKERLAEENRQLRALLAQHGLGISFPGGSVLDDSLSNPSMGYSPSASMAGSYAPTSTNTTAFTPPPLYSEGSGPGDGMSPPNSTPYPHGNQQHQWFGPGVLVAENGDETHPTANPNIDYEQAGIDFVLTLERPCMNHLPWMLERGDDASGREPCGHALMASCPPEPFSQLSPEAPFSIPNDTQVHNDNGITGVVEDVTNQATTTTMTTTDADGGEECPGTWNLNKGDLNTLLNLSKRLNLDGEITPVMAWGMVLAHPRLAELSPKDFERLAEELRNKVRCYGFGAVIEEFEVRDALENVLSMKPDYSIRVH